VNEELNTVNEELDARNTELGRVNADLINVLSSVDTPIVIVGDDLRIRRFTPAAERLFNLISGDVGRPIGQINPNFVCDNLERLIRTTIDSVAPREYEVPDRAGRWYSLRIRPYKGVDNRLDGAVLMAIDIHAAHQLQTRTENSLDYFTKIVEMVDQPLLVLDGNLRVRSANNSFRRMFENDGQRVEGSPFDALSNGEWNAPELRNVLSEALKKDATYHATRSLDGGRPRIGFKVRGFGLEDASRWILVAVETSDA